MKEIEKGDLLFFTTEKRRRKKGIEKVGHVALYIGNGKILHTSRKENKVHIASLRQLLLEGRYLVQGELYNIVNTTDRS